METLIVDRKGRKLVLNKSDELLSRPTKICNNAQAEHRAAKPKMAIMLSNISLITK